ncbi:MAG: DUF992 domain-containing protein [Mariprofundaceae bacterium]
MKIKYGMTYVFAAFALMAVGLISSQTALAEEAKTTAGTKVGVLSCKTVPGSGMNLIIHSTRNVTCEFKSTAGAGSENYKGEMGIGLGIDLNIKQDETIGYTVISADFKAGTYQLAGKYAGAKASATLGIGAGAAILLGGSDDSIALQPIALSGSTGLGVAAGIGYLYLEADKTR